MEKKLFGLLQMIGCCSVLKKSPNHANIMSMKVKARRHSFSSLEEAVKEVGKETPSTKRTAGAITGIPQSERKRKNPCELSVAADLTPETKRVAAPAPLTHLMESMQEATRKEYKHRTSDDFLCCLPGGRLTRVPGLHCVLTCS